MTREGGYCASESIDGKTLFFIRNTRDASPLFAQPLAGGPERQIAACVGTTFAVGLAGVYTLDCWSGPPPLFLRDPATGRGRLLGKLDRAARPEGAPEGFTVSPDGKTILYTRVVNQGKDLMMIDNFR